MLGDIPSIRKDLVEITARSGQQASITYFKP